MEGPTSRPNPCRNDGGSWVFLIARMYPVFEGVPAAMNVIAFTGALLVATIAITQNDIKRVWLTPRFPTGLHGDGDGEWVLTVLGCFT